jgi:hypothetical protein
MSDIAKKAEAVAPEAAQLPPPPEYDTEHVPAEFKADVERLSKLEKEEAELRDKLAEAGVVIPVKPRKPSFGMSEGTREELARVGRAIDPFTGEKLTRADLKKKK